MTLRDPTPLQQPDPLAEITFAHTTFTLPNGLTVIVAENHDTPVVSLNMVYLVGAKDEVAGKTGFAHLFEHLMFEGSENAPGSFITAMTRAGACDINAFTGPDRTTYHFTVPVGSLDYALFMESDRMGFFFSCINQQSLDQQRQVVLNEKMETESGPYGKVYETSVKATYPYQHPYAHTVIGETKDLEKATLTDVKEWFTRWYTPSNAILTLSGAISVDEARKKVEHWFGRIPGGEPQIRAERWVPQIPPGRIDCYQARVPDKELILYWNIPPFGEPDSIRLAMIVDYLTGSVSGQLIRALVYEDPVISHVSFSISPGVLCSQLILSVTLNNGQDPATVKQKLLDQIAHFILNGLGDDDLQQVRQDALASFSGSYRTSAQIAGLLCSSFAQWGKADGYLDIYRIYQKATSDDLQKTAQRWLNSNFYQLIIEPFDIPVTDGVTVLQHPVPAILPPASLRLPECQVACLDNGLKVHLAERHSYPDVYLDLLIPDHLSDSPGLSSILTELLNTSGTRDFDTFSFDKELRASGIKLQLRKRLNYISLTLSCRKNRLKEGLSFLRQRFSDSAISDQEINLYQQQQLSALSTQQQIASAQSLRILPALMYPEGHPCRVPQGIEMTGSLLQSLHIDSLTNSAGKLLSLAGSTLMISGDITLPEVHLLLNNTLGQVPKADWQPPVVPIPQVPAEPELYIIDIPGAEQSSLVAASLIPGIQSMHEAAFDLLNDIFANGFTSRLNLNLREHKNWTYGVKSGLINDPLHRVHFIQADIQTDKTCQALTELLKEYQEISSIRPVTEPELEQRRITSLLATAGWGEDLQDLNNLFSYIHRNQLVDDFWQHYQRQLSTVTLNEINQLAEEIFTVDKLTWVIAGDSSSFIEELSSCFAGKIQVLQNRGEDLYEKK